VGSDYYNLIFNPSGIQNLIETDLENYIQYAIKDINNINVRIKYFNDQKVIFAIKFSADTYLKNQLMECTIEVPLQ
jgi:RNA-binding protein YlmH